jgi:sulfur carrier protein ThiS
MNATLRPIGVLKTYIDNKAEVTVEAGQTVRACLLRLGMPPEIVALALVNDAQQPKDYVLQDGDMVKLIAVIGGG